MTITRTAEIALLCDEAREYIREANDSAAAEALSSIFADIKEVVMSLGDSELDTKELAQAIADFADWQWGGYAAGKDDATVSIVGRSLWEEVSRRVECATGQRPKDPGFGPSRRER